MTVRELIRILSVLSEDEKEYSVVFEDKKYGLYVMSDELRIRHEPRIVSLLSRDDPPKDLPQQAETGVGGEPVAGREDPQNFWQL